MITILWALIAVAFSSCQSELRQNNSRSTSVPADNATAVNATPHAVNGSPATPERESPNGDNEDPAAVIRDYYRSINAGRYRNAYELWSEKGEASKQTFEEFRNGFANTASVGVEVEKGQMEGAAGSQYATIPVRITARTKDGQEQRFSGEYVLRRSMVDGATPEQRSWRIYSAKIGERKE